MPVARAAGEESAAVRLHGHRLPLSPARQARFVVSGGHIQRRGVEEDPQRRVLGVDDLQEPQCPKWGEGPPPRWSSGEPTVVGVWVSRAVGPPDRGPDRQVDRETLNSSLILRTVSWVRLVQPDDVTLLRPAELRWPAR